jgi:hypothetical protein
MEPILVPATPKEAFNKNRRISDLIRKQIEHLKHLEEKLPAGVRATLPHHAIVTEDDAARYIAPMTRLLHARAAAAHPATTPIPMPQPTLRAQPAQGLDLAASASASAPAAKPRSAPKKSSTRARTMPR